MIRRVRPQMQWLEDRVVPSAYYDYEVLARSGQSPLTGIQAAVSLNDAGQVAFVGSVATGQDVFVSDGPSDPPAGITGSVASNVSYSRELQINDAGQVAAVQARTGATTTRGARVYSSTGQPFVNIGLASSPLVSSDHFDTLGSFASLANDGQLAFAGFDSPATTWEIHLSRSFVDSRDVFSPFSEVTSLPAGAFFRQFAADGDRVVLGSRDPAGVERVVLYDITGIDSSDTIATTGNGDWLDVGVRPGLTDDGTTVAFYGEPSAATAAALGLTPGKGVFVSSIDAASNQRVYRRLAGLTNNGRLDAGETFEDANGNGVLDAGTEVDLQPIYTFSGFDPDARVAVEYKGNTREAVTAAYVAFDEVGREGIYTTDMLALPAPVGGFTVTSASAVARVGFDIPGVGTLTDVAIHDALNGSGQVAVWVRAGATDAVVRANPVRAPILIVPGIVGSFPSGSYREWLLTRGLDPTKLAIDPLAGVYADLIQTLTNAGYTPGKDLFAAVYDWRLPNAPTDAGPADGVIAGLTADSITDGRYEYGVDYLGYWLKRAAERWAADHGGRPLPAVDLIGHSMGGLVARAYVQSAAYGGQTAAGLRLPKVDNLIMLATPNEGAVKAYNPFIQDNWNSDPLYRMLLSKFLLNAYRKVLGGETVAGPLPITRATVADPATGAIDADSPKRFIRAYVPSLRDLLATFDFLETAGGGLVGINDTPDRNALVLDLNAGLNTPAATGDRSRFAAVTRSTTVFGTADETVVRTAPRTGTGGGPPVIAPFNFFQRSPLGFNRPAEAGENYFEDVAAPAAGDATVPTNSLRSRFPGDPRFRVFELTEPATSHTEVVSNPTAQRLVLRTLGVHENSADPPTNISSGEAGPRLVFVLGTVVALIIDPVDAVLIDDQGRRLGFAGGTAFAEIPESVYVGDADGFGLIRSIPADLTLRLTGTGDAHLVAVAVGDGTRGILDERTLAAGQTEDLPVYAPPPNTPPRISPVGDQSTPADTPTPAAGFTVADDESAADQLVVAADSSNPALVPVGNISVAGTGADRTVTVTPAPGQSGTAVVTLTVRDPGGRTAATSFTVTVTAAAANAPPTVRLETVPPVGTFRVTVGDAETPADALTLTATATNPAFMLTLGGTGANRSLVVASAVAGTGTVTVTVTDAGGRTATATADVTFAGPSATNTPPRISTPADRLTTPGTPSAAAAFTLADDETPAGQLDVTAASSDPTLVPVAGILFGGGGADRTVTVVPAAGRTGTAVVTLTVRDPAGLTATARFTVTVVPPSTNTPPRITAPAGLTTAAGVPTAAAGFAVADDQSPADQLVVTVASSDPALVPAGNVVLGGSGTDRTVTVTPAAGRSGAATITLTVTDPNGLSAAATFTVTVTSPPAGNTPPTLAVGTPAGSRPVTIAVAVGDAETPASLLEVTVSTSNPALTATVAGGGANRTVTVTAAGAATGTVTVTVRDAGGLTTTRAVAVTVGGAAGPAEALVGVPQFAVGAGPGGPPTVSVFDPNGSVRLTALAFDPAVTGGVRTAVADFDRDGVPDVAAGTGPGGPTRVVVYSGATNRVLFDVAPFEASFTGGVYVAAGDLDGDGRPDLVVTPDEGGGPRVDVYSGNGFGRAASFFGIDDPNFRGGARASTGDINGDGTADLIVVAGFGGGPRVAGFDGKSVGTAPRKVFADFFAFESSLRNGVFVAAGDLDGDGFAELIAGGGPGGGPRVTAFSGKGLLANVQDVRANFFGGDANSRGGIRVGVKDLDGDARADVVVGAGDGAGSRVTGYRGRDIGPAGTPPAAIDFDAFPGQTGGVFVG